MRGLFSFEHKRAVITAMLVLVTAAVTRAQADPPSQSPPDLSSPQAEAENDPIPVMFPHPETDRVWISGQGNFVSQWHPAFHSPYQGRNSLPPEAQDASSRVLTLFTGLRLGDSSEVLCDAQETGGHGIGEAQDASSRVLTLFTGLRISDSTEVLCDVQETGGHGIGEALGIAGFTNLDVVRNPTLSKAPYVARLMWHQIIALTSKKASAERTPLSLFSQLPERRLEVRFGKLGLVDFFDQNTYGTDSNFQFMNWSLDNNGAYDYAADTRGFTFAAMIEYHDWHWGGAFRRSAHAQGRQRNSPGCGRGSRARREYGSGAARALIPRREGILRLLAYVNHANMGSYRKAIDDFRAGVTPLPDITAHPLQTTVKYGFGANVEQPLNDWLGVFGRWGWNEGRHESFAYTEVDETTQFGMGASGKRWGRRFDRAGLAFVTNGISRDHQQYLALGGLGFLLGDGRLNYGRENIVETYYTLHAWRGAYPSFGFQYVDHPGYNRDRGPVLVPTLRLHLEF